MKIGTTSKDIDWVLFSFLVVYLLIGTLAVYLENPTEFSTMADIVTVLIAFIITIFIYLIISYNRYKRTVYIVLFVFFCLVFVYTILKIFDNIIFSWPKYVINIAVLMRLYQKIKLTSKKPKKTTHLKIKK